MTPCYASPPSSMVLPQIRLQSPSRSVHKNGRRDNHVMAFSREALWADFYKQEGTEWDTAQPGSGRQRVSSSPPSIEPLYVASVYYRCLVCKESTFSPSIPLYGCLFSPNNFKTHYYGNFADIQYFYCIFNFYEISLRYKGDEVTGERRKLHDE